MQQMFPQLEPQKTDKVFMDKAGWQLLTLVATVVTALIADIILGTAHVIDFNWFVVIIVVIMLAIMSFCIWYTFRTRQKLYEQYNNDRAAYREEWQRFKETWYTYFENERFRWDDFAINFSRKNMEEQNKRHEELKRQCLEAIAGAENRMDSSIKNAQTIFTGAVESQRRAVDTYGEQLIHAQKQMGELEQRLRKELSLPDEETITPP
jgi:hypothetical protein